MSSFLVTLVCAFCVSIALVLWRVWPALRGRARDSDSITETAEKWNRYMAPLFRKHLGEEILVARANIFKGQEDGEAKSLATWSLAPTVIPTVDYVAVMTAHENEAPTIAGFIKLDALRQALPDNLQSQTLFGHTAWVCVWPEGLEVNALGTHLMASESFRAHHGLERLDKGDAND